MAEQTGSGLTPSDYFDLFKWVVGACAFLAWGWFNRVVGRVDKHDSRLDNHAQRLTALDGKTESE